MRAADVADYNRVIGAHNRAAARVAWQPSASDSRSFPQRLLELLFWLRAEPR